MIPVVLVHGLWDNSKSMAAMDAYLQSHGRDVTRIDLRPADGRAPIRTLARQLSEDVARVAGRAKSAQVDLVGHSMGALVSRTYIQREGGRDRVRRFVSVAGPHQGSHLAFALSLLPGIRDMRPGSTHLKDLERDEDPWGNVEVHCFLTPWDLLIRPIESAVLTGAKSVHRIDVKMHRWMNSDPRVLERIAKILA